MCRGRVGTWPGRAGRAGKRGSSARGGAGRAGERGARMADSGLRRDGAPARMADSGPGMGVAAPRVPPAARRRGRRAGGRCGSVSPLRRGARSGQSFG